MPNLCLIAIVHLIHSSALLARLGFEQIKMQNAKCKQKRSGEKRREEREKTHGRSKNECD
jgi:hypothetical protein